jgi:peptidoglycan/LPS O-acetylase OafA/YrhL
MATHSYAVLGIPKQEWLFAQTKQLTFAAIGLGGFFTISGYLVFKSLLNAPNIVQYLFNRVLRIYPALLVMLIVTIFLGQFIYNNTIPYWQNKTVYTYVSQNLTLYRNQYQIIGLFKNSLQMGIGKYGSVNSSLHTLANEFTLYLIIIPLFFIKNKLQLLKICTVAIFLFLLIVYIGKPAAILNFNFLGLVSNWGYYGIYFFTGALLFLFNIAAFKYKKQLLLITLLTVIGLLYFNSFGKALGVVFFATFVILLALVKMPKILQKFIPNGDYSYGVYLYAFPIQQVLANYFTLSYFTHFCCSFFIAFLFAYFSWHVIEKPMLRLKSANWLQLLKQKQCKYASTKCHNK